MIVTIRDYDEVSDQAFIMSTWLKNFKDSSSVRAVPAPIYMEYQRKRIERILARRDTKIHVASSYDCPEFFYGYIVIGKPNVIHYMYVKQACRKVKIAERLMEKLIWSEPIFYTHKSPDFNVERLLKENPKYSHFIYCPYLLEETQDVQA